MVRWSKDRKSQALDADAGPDAEIWCYDDRLKAAVNGLCQELFHKSHFTQHHAYAAYTGN